MHIECKYVQFFPSLVYFCIVIGDPIIKGRELGSHKPNQPRNLFVPDLCQVLHNQYILQETSERIKVNTHFANILVHFLFIFFDNMHSECKYLNIFFFIVCLYLHWRGKYNYHVVGIQLTRLIPQPVDACLKPVPGFPMPYVTVFFHVQWVEVSGDYSFYW